MHVAHVPESDYKSGPHCARCENRNDLVLRYTASRDSLRRLREGQLEPAQFSPNLDHRLVAILCEDCNVLWKLVPDSQFEVEKALAEARAELARRDQLMESPSPMATVIL